MKGKKRKRRDSTNSNERIHVVYPPTVKVIVSVRLRGLVLTKREKERKKEERKKLILDNGLCLCN